MTASPVASLAIGIASSPDDRQRLAQLLGATDAFLIVSTVDQARQFLNVVAAPGDLVPPVVLAGSGVVPPVVLPEPVTATPGPRLTVDSDRRVLRWQEREIPLTPLEHDFMRCLTGAPGRVWTYQRLHLEVWGNEHVGRGSDIHSVVRRVRSKLALLNAKATIHAIRGVGFRLNAPV
ncbi:winged helix-turn-helix domain-containing protein [Jidongwangia harbinensis]|uniref:winged helix-turn-helix domain-containing protein n=1 Tax=Jidongwangia harbinensis TaxID=2878561 RepID=UPI001CDA3D7F|nr:winged helix-turn-helix domain-containing protein [Jidongwangia harbinensis]MCA2215952.1 winged helix-turn-helix domain-containing protein [Jidongwangia harbinensis]